MKITIIYPKQNQKVLETKVDKKSKQCEKELDNVQMWFWGWSNFGSSILTFTLGKKKQNIC